jgi:hypothetical protein
MSTIRKGLIILTSLVICTIARADWLPPQIIVSGFPLEMGSGQSVSQRTLYATEGDTLHLVWMKTDAMYAFNIHYQHSYDGGVTWSNDFQLTDIPDGSMNAAMMPCIAVSGQNVHVVWLYGGYDTYTSQGVVYRHSTDAGQTWSDAIYIAPGYGGELGGINPQLIAVGDRLHILWNGFSTSPGDTRAKTFYCTSLNGGQTWGTPIQVSQHSEDSHLRVYQTTLAVLGDNIHVAWVALGLEEVEFIYYRHSTDGGATWENQQEIEDNPNGSEAPNIAVTPAGVVHLMWTDCSSNEHWSIKYVRSFDNGATWQDPVNMDVGIPGVWSWSPVLQTRGNELHAAYCRRIQPPSDPYYYEVHYRKSLDQGVTWSDTVMTEHSIRPALANNSHRVYMVWEAEFFTDISFTYEVNGPLSHGPTSFDLLLPENQDTLTTTAAQNVAFSWELSTDPDSGDIVTYSAHIQVSQAGSETVFLTFNDLTQPGLNLNLLSASGFNPPTHQLNVMWWATAHSNGDTVTSSAAHHMVIRVTQPNDANGNNPNLRSFSLAKAYPNPFNAQTVIHFELKTEQQVRLQVFDILGKQMAILTDRKWTAGSHAISIDASAWPSGIYFLNSEMGLGNNTILKLVLLK